MNPRTLLEVSLNEILHVVDPLKEDLETRIQIIDQLREVVSAIESLRGMLLYLVQHINIASLSMQLTKYLSHYIN